MDEVAGHPWFPRSSRWGGALTGYPDLLAWTAVDAVEHSAAENILATTRSLPRDVIDSKMGHGHTTWKR